MSTGRKDSAGARKEGAHLLIPLMVLFTGMLSTGAARAETDLPLFDGHVHYNREAWEGCACGKRRPIGSFPNCGPTVPRATWGPGRRTLPSLPT
jgi:hypothetical protein